MRLSISEDLLAETSRILGYPKFGLERSDTFHVRSVPRD